MGKHVDRAVGGKTVEAKPAKSVDIQKVKAFKDLTAKVETLEGVVEQLADKIEAIIGAIPATKEEVTE